MLGNDKTAKGVVNQARTFYESVGKITIEVKKERNGHVANRLQAALWREAISLVRNPRGRGQGRLGGSGPTLGCVGADDPVPFGCGCRWIAGVLRTFHGWWDELGHAKLDEATIKILVDGISDAHGDASQADLSAARDALILAMQQATKPLR